MFQQKVESKNMHEQMMTNPDMMQGMMKAQLGGVLPQVGGGWCPDVLPLRYPGAQPVRGELWLHAGGGVAGTEARVGVILGGAVVAGALAQPQAQQLGCPCGA